MIRNFLRNFMIGRYGPDHLNIAMIIFSFVLSIVHGITRFTPILYISYIVLALAVFRVLSRNIPRRRAENDKFIRYWWPVRTRLKRVFTEIKDRRIYKYFKCPSCGNTLRVPKGKGKLQVTCPKCGERFFKKS
ncbi:MAG: hypothetical protein FWB97_09120 [Oscillospiraceae bacterium]|nr:hypothetical protein [Oscillospiraceae bacterium]MCL2227765.1 hypothetical protein [Oscillospiraceae bacterium]